MQRRGTDRPTRRRRAAAAFALAVLAGAGLVACGDDDTGEDTSTPVGDEAREETAEMVLVDDVTVEAAVDGDGATLRVTAPVGRDVGVADAALAGRRVEGDAVVYRRIASGGEGGAEAPSGRVLVVRAGETLELPSTAGLEPGTTRICVEVIDPLQYGDADAATGDEVTVDQGPGDQFACVEVGGA